MKTSYEWHVVNGELVRVVTKTPMKRIVAFGATMAVVGALGAIGGTQALHGFDKLAQRRHIEDAVLDTQLVHLAHSEDHTVTVTAPRDFEITHTGTNRVLLRRPLGAEVFLAASVYAPDRHHDVVRLEEWLDDAAAQLGLGQKLVSKEWSSGTCHDDRGAITTGQVDDPQTGIRLRFRACIASRGGVARLFFYAFPEARADRDAHVLAAMEKGTLVVRPMSAGLPPGFDPIASSH